MGLLVSLSFVAPKDKKQDKLHDPLLCVGDYWPEAEGKALLEKMRQTYTIAEDWNRCAIQICTQILIGSGLEKCPNKCPLNPDIGEKRVYDGYKVQNIAFESLQGVYVTGSLEDRFRLLCRIVDLPEEALLGALKLVLRNKHLDINPISRIKQLFNETDFFIIITLPDLYCLRFWTDKKAFPISGCN